MGIKITELTIDHLKQYNPKLIKKIQEAAPYSESKEVPEKVVEQVTKAARREAVRQQKFL